MDEFQRYSKSMFVIMTLIAAAATVGLALVFPSDPRWAYGFALGAVGQLVKFRLLDIPTVVLVGQDPKNASKIQLRSSFLGYGIMAVVFFLAIWLRASIFQPWMTLGGVFLPRLVLVADGFIRPNLFAKPGPPTPDAPPATPGENPHDAQH